MRHLKTYFAILGGSVLASQIVDSVMHSKKEWHAEKIWIMQSKLSAEIDLYESKWGKKVTDDHGV